MLINVLMKNIINNKNNIKELQRQTLINILNVKGIIYNHYKNKQKGNHEKNNTTIQCAKNILC